MRVRVLLATVLALVTGHVLAQTAVGADDFKEIEAPAPPAYHKEKLIAIDMPSSAALKYGVDPDTLSVGHDGVVRYVMVAYNPGSVNALYEGLRCETGEVKTYARSSELGHWTLVQQPTWRPVDMSSSTRHTLALAKQGVCDGYSLASSKVSELLRLLRTPIASQRPN